PAQVGPGDGGRRPFLGEFQPERATPAPGQNERLGGGCNVGHGVRSGIRTGARCRTLMHLEPTANPSRTRFSPLVDWPAWPTTIPTPPDPASVARPWRRGSPNWSPGSPS